MFNSEIAETKRFGAQPKVHYLGSMECQQPLCSKFFQWTQFHFQLNHQQPKIRLAYDAYQHQTEFQSI